MECPICLDLYESPVLLPGCGHTLCQACIELIITKDKVLRCPECRLLYQLKNGVKSLPKNVALQKAIDQHKKLTAFKQNALCICVTCEEHPNEIASLYCNTCDKCICLKCYFHSNHQKMDDLVLNCTNKVLELKHKFCDNEQFHAGHIVLTADEVIKNEKKSLEKIISKIEGDQRENNCLITYLETTDGKLKKRLDSKLISLEQAKNDLILEIKQISAKLKFTLRGSVAQEFEMLQSLVKQSKEKAASYSDILAQANNDLLHFTDEKVYQSIENLKLKRKKLEEIINAFTDKNTNDNNFEFDFSNFGKYKHLKEIMDILDKFDLNILGCLNDNKKGLAYQTVAPKYPWFDKVNCIISEACVLIAVRYNEHVRVYSIAVYYEEALNTVITSENINSSETTELYHGVCNIIIKNLKQACSYKCYAMAINQFGQTRSTFDLCFTTLQGESNIKEVSPS